MQPLITGGTDASRPLHDLGRPLSPADVRLWLAQQPVGSPVLVHFSYDGEHARWWGHLMQRGRQRCIMFIAAQCTTCNAWHPLDEESPYDVPFPGSSYFELREAEQPLIVPPCTISDSDDSDDSIASLHEVTHEPPVEQPASDNPPELQPAVEASVPAPDPQMLPIFEMPSSDASALSARAARNWWIYEGRPRTSTPWRGPASHRRPGKPTSGGFSVKKTQTTPFCVCRCRTPSSSWSRATLLNAGGPGPPWQAILPPLPPRCEPSHFTLTRQREWR